MIFRTTLWCMVSPPLLCTMIHTAPSAAPSNLQVISISSSSLHFQWNPPPLEHRNGIIRRYVLFLLQLNSETRVQQSSLTESITFSNLKPYTTYRCKVAAYTTALGPFSSEVQNRTHEDGKYHRSMSGWLLLILVCISFHSSQWTTKEFDSNSIWCKDTCTHLEATSRGGQEWYNQGIHYQCHWGPQWTGSAVWNRRDTAHSTVSTSLLLLQLQCCSKNNWTWPIY